MKLVDLIIKNGAVLTVDNTGSIFFPGAVAVKGDSIVAVGMHNEICGGFKGKKEIDARGGIVMPGMVNTHTHASMSCFRGLADDLPLMAWLKEHIFSAEAYLSYDMVYIGARLACAEMILSGTTTFCDMYLFEDAVAEAAKNSGMRAVVGEVLYDFPSPNYGPIEKGFEYTEMLFHKWENDPLIKIAVEPHSPYLCSPELLKKAKMIADKYRAPLVIHVAETKDEVNQIRERYGDTPVSHLAKCGILCDRLIADHSVFLTDDEIAMFKQYEVKVAHNPESNMKLASGVSPISKLISLGVTVGLGTDGCASNNNLDMFQEMDTAAKIHKVTEMDSTVMDAKTVVRMATINGAEVLGLKEICGSLEAGKRADIIVIDTKKPHLTPMYDYYSSLVYSANGSDISTVIINGSVVCEERILTTIDLKTTMESAIQMSEKVKGYSSGYDTKCN
ncbi:MAG: amidohydrolase [Pseudomonadota bacterium]